MSKPKEDEDRGDCLFSRLKPAVACSIFVLLVGIAGIVTCVVLRNQMWLPNKFHYGVVVDAGSSHTDLQLFSWPSNKKYEGDAELQEISSLTCSKVGIAAFAKNPSEAGVIIDNCVKDVISKAVPRKYQSKTIVFVGATAGMRLLCKTNMTVCDDILNSIKASLSTSPFLLKNDSVRVLTGKEEATFGWISLNVLENKLQQDNRGEKQKQDGTLDLGGASFEVAFQPDNATVLPAPYSSDLHLYGHEYNIYSHSYLCYGGNEAERRTLAKLAKDSNFTDVVVNPCYAKGYSANLSSAYLWKAPCSVLPNELKARVAGRNFTFIGNSSYDKCRNVIDSLFNETVCKTPPCSFNGVYQPHPNGKFVAFALIAIMADTLNVSKNGSLDSFGNASRRLCSKHWPQLKAVDAKMASNLYAPHLCFRGAYSHALMVDGLHFQSSANRVVFEKSIKGTDVSWSLGLMVNSSANISDSKLVPRLSSEDFLAAVVGAALVSIIGIVLVIFFTVFRRTPTIAYRRASTDA